MTPVRISGLLAGLATTLSFAALASEDADRREVARLDTEYQAAVKRNDADGMGRVLHERVILVLGNGKTFNRKELIDSAKAREIVYEKQDEEPGTQTVRVWGDTEKPFERRLWFSDTYVRTPEGWKHVFGQASLPLP